MRVHGSAPARLVLCAFAVACSGSGTQLADPDPDPLAPPTLTRTIVTSGLNRAWDLAVQTDGTIFYTEACAGLSVRLPSGTTIRLFGPTGASLAAPDLSCEGQSGMHGVALDPEFATNRRIYVYMGSTLTTPRTNRVVRLVASADLRSVSQRADIVTDIPFKHVGTPNGGAGAHSGGRIRFGPDGLLYVATGDNHNAVLPQSPTLLGGKVLRITTEGAAAPANAPPTGFDRRIFAYGFRNVQGLSFRPSNGQLFTGEHGPNHTDEVTPVVNGGNAGWDPRDRPSLTCPDNYCGYAGTPSSMPMTDSTRFPTAMRPAWTNNGQSAGTGPVEFLRGSAWGAWNGRLAVGVMRAGRLDVLALDAAGRATEVTSASLPTARVRALTLAPDASLYVVTDAGEIWRVVAAQ
jgi:aldose sugar dehydrogenase